MKITDIKVIDRRRRANEDTVRSLADSLSSVGLINPVTVNKEGRLLAGLHRIEAAKLLEWTDIDATVLDVDDLGARLAEIDENLIREDLSVLERGEWLLERKAIYEEMYPETKNGAQGRRGSGDGQEVKISENDKLSFSENTSNLTGKVARSVERDVRRAANIPQDVRDDIRDIESIANSGVELDALAAMPEEEQRETVALVKSGQARSVRSVRAHDLEEKAHVSHNSGNNEWYTPPDLIEAARQCMGSIDVDPASSEIANETVKAETFYSSEDDGLSKDWIGNVWMNPPYAQPLVAQFSEAVCDRYSRNQATSACILVNNATDTVWFHRMMDSSSAVCFLKSRVRFLDPKGNATGAPLQGQAVLYMGDDVDSFLHSFSPFGKVLFDG